MEVKAVRHETPALTDDKKAKQRGKLILILNN
jgi:hypothetical protein